MQESRAHMSCILPVGLGQGASKSMSEAARGLQRGGSGVSSLVGRVHGGESPSERPKACPWHKA